LIDAASNVVTVTYPNNVQSAMSYDTLNRITGLATQTAVVPLVRTGFSGF
jgi:YD repeat-containing protein